VFAANLHPAARVWAILLCGDFMIADLEIAKSRNRKLKSKPHRGRYGSTFAAHAALPGSFSGLPITLCSDRLVVSFISFGLPMASVGLSAAQVAASPFGFLIRWCKIRQRQHDPS